MAFAFELSINSKNLRFQVGRFRVMWDYREPLVTKEEHKAMPKVNPRWPLEKSWHFMETYLIVDCYGSMPA